MTNETLPNINSYATMTRDQLFDALTLVGHLWNDKQIDKLTGDVHILVIQARLGIVEHQAAIDKSLAHIQHEIAKLPAAPSISDWLQFLPTNRKLGIDRKLHGLDATGKSLCGETLATYDYSQQGPFPACQKCARLTWEGAK